ncbi:MAG TPA: response regulator transcription factor [Bacteroidales bacterium]|nr:response regulator transcription factor [Bacteroidales bacterium]
MINTTENNSMDTEKIKILLVDDSRIILDGLAFNFLLQHDFSVTGKALSVQEALQSISAEIPDVVLLDISLQEEADGIDLLREMGQKYPAIKVLIFSQQKEVKAIVDSVRAGARAYLSKDSSVEEIIGAVRMVAQGNGLFLGETIPPETLHHCFSGKPERKNFTPYHLSDREIEIIRWLSKGYLSKEIAEIEHINVSTIESHKDNIKNKLGLKSIIEVVVFCIKNGIIAAE